MKIKDKLKDEAGFLSNLKKILSDKETEKMNDVLKELRRNKGFRLLKKV